MNFELILKGERVKPHQSTGLHLLVALAIMMSGAITFFLYKLFKVQIAGNMNTALEQLKWAGLLIVLTGLVLLALIIFKNKWLLKKKVNAIIRIVELAWMLFFTLFSITEHIIIPAFTYGILAVTVVLALIWENTGGAQLVAINEEGIKLPVAVRTRLIAWPEIEKVLLRYNVLTIDCLDKKLLQLDVKAPVFNSDNFEQYCDTKIEEGKKKRHEEW